MGTFADWSVQLEDILSGGTQSKTSRWLIEGAERIAEAATLTQEQRWAKIVTPAMKWSAYQTNLFWSTVGGPGFWCQLFAFLVAGAVFRSFGFGDGPHNGVMLDATTFTIGWVLETTLAASMPAYSTREENSGPLQYAQRNYLARLAIVPFTSTFVPLLYGWSTGSLENIAACWVQHFVVLAVSWWALVAPVADGERDFRGRPYAQAAFFVERLRVRLSALGPFVLPGDATVALYEQIRETEEARPRTPTLLDLTETPRETTRPKKEPAFVFRSGGGTARIV